MPSSRLTQRNPFPALLTIGLLSLAAAPRPAPALVLNPDDLPRMIAERNQAVRGGELQAEAADRRTGYLARSFVPYLSLDLGGERFQTGRYATLTQPYALIEARMNLFRGGRDLFEGRALGARSEAARAESRKIRAQSLAQARELYWALVFEREQVRILKAALEENAKNLASANRRIQRGLSTDTDRLEFQIQESQLKEEIESFAHRSKQTLIQLRAVLGLEGKLAEEPIETVDVIPHEHDESLLSLQLDPESNYDVALLRANESSARAEAAQLGRWWLPSLDAYAGYYRYTLRDRDYLSDDLLDDRVAGLRLTLKLDPWESVSADRSAASRAEALENRMLQQKRETLARFRVSQEDMKHEHELTHEAEHRVEQGTAYLAKTLSEYDRGLKNAPDVLGASLRLLGFRRRYSEIRRNYQLAKSELLSMLGR